ncbi:MAG TPA: alpha/beta hydrolase [Mycobacteriales bacterium]
MSDSRSVEQPAQSKAPATRYLDRPQGRIAYDIVGDGDGPLVVCVPGMGSLRAVYRQLATTLAAAGNRVATMDLRGHGDSDATFTSYDDPASAGDILALVAHLGGPVTLVGNSMGAAVSVLAAATEPDSVAGLVLVDPFVRDIPTSAATRLLMRAAMAGPWAGRVWISYLPKLFPTRRDADFDRLRAAIAASLRRPDHRRAFSATTRTSHAPAEAVLDQVRVPTLVVMGEKDPDFPDPTAEANLVAERLGGQAVLVPAAGHYPQAEFPELVGPAVVDFMRRMATDA